MVGRWWLSSRFEDEILLGGSTPGKRAGRLAHLYLPVPATEVISQQSFLDVNLPAPRVASATSHTHQKVMISLSWLIGTAPVQKEPLPDVFADARESQVI